MIRFILVAGLSLAGATATAEVQSAVQPTQTDAEVMKPLSLNDVRIMLSETIALLKEKILNAQKLTEEERIRIARDIEREAMEAQEALDTIIDESAKLGETTY